MVCKYDKKLSALICWSKFSNYIINAVKSTLLHVAKLRKLGIGWQNEYNGYWYLCTKRFAVYNSRIIARLYLNMWVGGYVIHTKYYTCGKIFSLASPNVCKYFLYAHSV